MNLANSLGSRAEAERTPGTRRRRARLGFLRGTTERQIGVAILLVCALAFIVIPAVDPTSPSAILAAPNQAPSAQHLFGTDQTGRDIFARVFTAGRLDLALTVVSVAVSVGAGVLAGLVLITLPGALRELCLRAIDAILSIPYLILVFALVAAVGTRQLLPGVQGTLGAIFVALTMTAWAPYARFTVAEGLALRRRESVIAARLLGYGYFRILLRHIAPAVLATNLSYAAAQAVSTTAAIASLAFLGVGVQEPTPELGQMMQEGIDMLPVAWWVSIVPGLAVLILGVGFGFVADSFGTRSSR